MFDTSTALTDHNPYYTRAIYPKHIPLLTLVAEVLVALKDNLAAVGLLVLPGVVPVEGDGGDDNDGVHGDREVDTGGVALLLLLLFDVSMLSKGLDQRETVRGEEEKEGTRRTKKGGPEKKIQKIDQKTRKTRPKHAETRERGR